MFSQGLFQASARFTHLSNIFSTNFQDAIFLSGPLMFVLLVSLIFLRHPLKYVTSKLPKGRLGFPILGETIQYVRNPMEFYRSRAKKYGTPFLTHVLFGPAVVMGETDDEMRWLWNTERKGESRLNWPQHWIRLMGSTALPFTWGKQHRYLRKMLDPAFSPKGIRNYVSIIDRCTQEGLEKWSNADSYHPSTVFKSLVFRTFFECALGPLDQNVMDELCADFTIWIEAFSTIFPFPLPGTLYSKGLAARSRLIQFLKKMIHDFKKINSPESENARSTVLGRLCYQEDDDGNRLSDEDLSTNLFVVLWAGHDTMYASLGTFLSNLFGNDSLEWRRVLNALVEEVSSFKNEQLDFDELKDAPILNAFLAESWRKDPPVPAGSKVALQDLPYKDWIFPKGVRVHYSIHLGAYNELRYRHPSEFHIERFLPKEHPLVKEDKWHVDDASLRDIMKPSFPIFGGGSHGCLGSHFAILESRIFVTRLLQKYQVEIRNAKRQVNFPLISWTSEFKLIPK